MRSRAIARPRVRSGVGLQSSDGKSIYFTLSDLQSDIWLATVTGLKK